MAKREYSLYVLGARGSRPVHGKDFEIFGGQTTCFIVKTGNHAIVIDCGTGLFDAGKYLEDCDIVDVVFTHVHYDHVLGMLDSGVFPKNARITFYGTFSAWLGHETFDEFFRHPFWPIQPYIAPICEIKNSGESINLADGFVLTTYKSNHPDNGNVILLQAGEKKLCFMFDVEVGNAFDVSILRGCDVLVFDGMFDDEEYTSHIGWGHSTYQQGCTLAQVYGVKKLLITHHNPKNDDQKLIEFENKAKLIFANTRFCRAGDIFIVE